MKKLGISLVLAIMMSVLGLEQVNMPDQRLSVDQGHYVGLGSVAGEHADELETQKTGFTLHSGISFYKNGLVEGSLKTQAALYGYDVYRLIFSPSFHNAISIRFVYDAKGNKGWLTLHRQSGAAGYYYQGGTHQFTSTTTYVYLGEKAKEWQDFCRTEFPKIKTEDLKNGGCDGGTFVAAYVIDGQYDTFCMWCPDKEKAPTFVKVIETMAEPFGEQLEFIQGYIG